MDPPAEHERRAGSVDEIRRVLDLQRVASQQVRQRTAAERAAVLRRLEYWIEENKDRVRAALHDDLRKPEAEVDVTEVLIPLLEIRHTCRHLRRWMHPKWVRPTLPMLGTRAQIRYEPRGMVLILSPFNYPFLLTVEPLISAIAAGNCVVLKPSELSPATSALVAAMVHELFDEAEVAVFEGDANVAGALLREPFDHIYFTGSQKVGSIVMRAAAEHHATITLELGGKSPTIVDATADIERAAARIAWGKFGNAGHTCIAPDYILVEASVAGRLQEELVKVIERFYGGDPPARAATPDLGRIVDDRHMARLKALLEGSIEMGARLAFGGNMISEERYIEPTLLTGVDPRMPIMQEEIFGPILPILTWERLDDALHTIHALPRPLALYVFSEARRVTERILAETPSGTACVNDVAVHYLHRRLPFGGMNASGQGAAHGWYGFRELSHERSVLKQGRLLDPFRLMMPPYGTRVRRLLNMIIRWVG